jgi:hypothetical protein
VGTFYVYWNTVVKKIRIHRSECGACKNGRGMHEGKIGVARGHTEDWIPAATYQEAVAIAGGLQREKHVLKVLRSSIDCGLCRPQFSK